MALIPNVERPDTRALACDVGVRDARVGSIMRALVGVDVQAPARVRSLLPVMLINGDPDGRIDPRDRGLHYGDGLFETIAVRAQHPRHWERHMGRLRVGCERLGLPLPDFAALANEARRVCAGAERAVLKIIWTRGPGGRGYAPHGTEMPTRIVARYPAPEYPRGYRDMGIRTRWCAHRLGLNPTLAGIKHLNRLDQVLARGEWQDPDIAEGFVCDLEGRLISATMSNVFLVRNQRLQTPDLRNCGVAGIARERILELARSHNVHCTLTETTPQDLLDADEVFVCNSVNGVWPVRSLDTRQWSSGELTRFFAHQLESD